MSKAAELEFFLKKQRTTLKSLVRGSRENLSPGTGRKEPLREDRNSWKWREW